tara:strand:- start:160941 stop:161339 length:399 start_codon:yes stop_codon:yes gene_type:complete
MNHPRHRQISSRTGLVLLGIAIVLPVVLSFLMADRSLLAIPPLVVPLILMGVWSDLGFVLGFFFFWATWIGLTGSSGEPGEVDNMLPGLAIGLGWMPYVLFYGPVFLFMKSNDRFKAKWLETHSEEVQDPEV